MLILFSMLFLGGYLDLAAQDVAPISSTQLAAFAPRSIGPAVTGGRVHDVEVLPNDPNTLFVATASGGLWLSTNRGHTWRNVFDTMAVSTFGDVAVSASDPNVVYAGTGEQNNRQSTSWGNGIYRSSDRGESWDHIGLEETRHIGKVEVDPRDSDVVFVAALGNLWRSSSERGVFRSRDGGQTWDRVLFIDEHTGAVDLVMDPSNPAILYAATYQRLRKTWGFNGGGPGSGIYKSTDGGDSWRELTNGIPEGDKGRIGLAISASNPRVLNALVQHGTASGTYRSEDAGESWTKVSDRNGRPMYYSEVFIDPSNEDRVYILATSSFRSEDGGRTFVEIAARPTYDVGVHADHHALWIDPGDPNHLLLGGDAGLHESYDRGKSFRRINNFAISQFYGIGVDMREPYNVYGGLQDNHSFMGPSRTRRWAGILNDDWRQIGFGDGMYWQIDPSNPRYAYGNAQNGGYTRVDTETGDMLTVRPRAPLDEERYRWDWVSPSLISIHNPATVYVGGNRLFTSRDRGVSWERSADLTRAIDRDTLELMGVRGSEMTISPNDGTSSYGEITTMAESPLDASVLWVGTDDGNVQVTQDGGQSWSLVSGAITGVRDGTYVSRVIASRSRVGTAYVAFDAHRDGDFEPYLFRTEDFGATWEARHGGLPTGSVNAVVEYPDNGAVLFVGTEHAVFVTTNGGADWARMPNLPTTHYDDLVIHPREKDLVLGTHGRGVWILDDISPLGAWSANVAEASSHLFPVRPAILFHYWKDTSYRSQEAFAGVNPVDGAIITYSIGPAGGSARLSVEAADGRVVREMVVPGGAGVHRINWDLRHGTTDGSAEWTSHRVEGMARSVNDRGPFVSPGRYTAVLEAGGTTSRQDIEVLGDPEMPITLAQYRERETFLLEVLALTERLDAARIRGASRDGATQERIRRAANVLENVYNSINGRGVRQGTLYPPTTTQRNQVGEVVELLRVLERETAETPMKP